MLTQTYSASVVGVDGHIVTVEADVGLGLPGLTLVGQASGALVEARERVKTALRHCGLEVPKRRQVVNLAPAELRKDSAGLDLAVACALLASYELIPGEGLETTLFWGELALDGTLRPVGGTLVVADRAKAAGFRTVVVPRASADEAALIPDIEVIAAESLPRLIAHLRREQPLPAHPRDTRTQARDMGTGGPDMADVRGLALGRLAIEVMVAGGHNLLLHGPPGVGKTMLARRAAGLFPELQTEEALQVTKIHSVVRRSVPGGLIRRAPMRAPHHTVSAAGLLGGGAVPRPGEVSLAHRGLLFLDELPEFPRACLEGLREPLEAGVVDVVRARYAVRFPARFQLLAAMNPCPCGYLGHPERTCVCSVTAAQRYRQKLSGPLLDRLDLVVPMVPPTVEELEAAQPGERSAEIRRRIAHARARQRTRLEHAPWTTNAEIPASDGAIDQFCSLTVGAGKLLRQVAVTRQMSPRAQHRVRKVARTLADLETDGPVTAPIGTQHVAKALHLRRMPDLGDS